MTKVYVYTVDPYLDKVQKRDYIVWKKWANKAEKRKRTPHLVFESERDAWRAVLQRADAGIEAAVAALETAESRYAKCEKRLKACGPGANEENF